MNLPHQRRRGGDPRRSRWPPLAAVLLVVALVATACSPLAREAPGSVAAAGGTRADAGAGAGAGALVAGLTRVASLVAGAAQATQASPPDAAASPQASPPVAAASPQISPSVSPSGTLRPPKSHEPLPSLEPLPPLAADAARPALSHEVVAYLPYWLLDVSSGDQSPAYDPATDPYLQGARLTDVVLFSIGVRRDGSLRLDSAGGRLVLGDAGTAIIETAHAHGIRVLVSFTSGGYTNNDALFGDPLAQDRFVTEATALVTLRGLDGADMDVELIKKPRFAAYAQTAGKLQASLSALNPLARVMVATNGSKSGATMASMALAAGAERAFLMGYAYRSPGSDIVGSISPIDNSLGLDLRESLDLYAAKGVPLDQVILGLPAYGLTWATTGPELHAPRAPASVSAQGRVFLFRNAVDTPLPAGAILDADPVESSARITWFDAGRQSWFQTYYDTPATLRPKYLLAFERGLAGVGMFTLGYDGGLAGYPELVGDVFSLPVVAVATVSPAATEVLDVTVAATLYDGLAMTDGVRLSNDGTTWSDWLDPATAPQMAWQLNDGADGPRVVYVQSRDVSGALSTPFEAAVVLDRTAPIIDTLKVAADGLGGWKATFAVTDLGGLAALELRSRGPDGVWSGWTALDTAATSALVPTAGTDVEVELRATDRVGHVTVMSAAGSAAASPGAAPSPGTSAAPSPGASAAPSPGASAEPSPGASAEPSPGASTAPSPGASAAPSAATGVRPTLPSIAGSATA